MWIITFRVYVTASYTYTLNVEGNLSVDLPWDSKPFQIPSDDSLL